jgi:ADP-ribose pyrophosphatase
MALVGGEVVLLRQYRHAINEWKLEFPCGSIEDNEAAINAAKRELLEETGFIAGEIIPLGSQYIRPGISTGKVHFFLAHIVSSQAAKPEPTEFIEVLTIPITKFEEMIKTGEFEQMLAIVCWIRSQKHLIPLTTKTKC